MNKKRDISKRMVAVLFVAAILISVLGTLTVLTTLNQTVSEALSVTKGNGQVSVEIILPESQTSAGSGNVNIEIINQGKNLNSEEY